MPTYEYICKKCKKTFEEFQSITAEPLSKCKFCKGKVERHIGGGAGLIFKGSGFYKTDYRSSDYKSKEKLEKTKSEKPKPEKPKSCPAKTDSCKSCSKSST